MQQSRRQHRAGRADRVAMRDRAAFDIDDVRVQTEVLRDCNCYRRKRLVDLDALDIRDFPAGASLICVNVPSHETRSTAITEQDVDEIG